MATGNNRVPSRMPNGIPSRRTTTDPHGRLPNPRLDDPFSNPRSRVKDEVLVLSKDTIDSLNILNKTLTKTDTKQLKKAIDHDLVEKKLQQKEQQKTLEKLNETLILLANKTSLTKEETLSQIKKKKGPAFEELSKISPEEMSKIAQLLNSQLGREIEQELINMKTDNEKSLEEYEIAEKEKIEIAKQEKEELKEYWSKTLEKWQEHFENHEDQIKNSLLGPLMLLVSPIEEFTNSSLFKGIGNFFEKRKERKAKKARKNPKEQDLVNNNDVAMLFFWHKTKEFFGEKKEKAKGGIQDLLKGLLGGTGIAALAKNASGLMGKFGIAALIGGLIWATIDGITAMGKAKEWKVSKVSAFIGGFLGGNDVKGGFKSAFKNMGKWALIGVGVGMLAAGPVGALIGGLAGAALGGIFGFFGGQKIAQGLDKAGKWIAKVWNDFINSGFVQNLVSMFSGIFDSFLGFFKDQFKNIKDLFEGKKTIGQFLLDFVKGLFIFVSSVVMDVLDKTAIGQMLQIYLINPITNFFNMIGDFFKFIGSMKFTDLMESVATGKFGEKLESYRSAQIQERQFAKKSETVFNYMNDDKSKEGKQVLSYFNQIKSPELQRKYIDNYFNTLVEKKMVDPKVVSSVHDAIITSDGKIIRTDVNDTIVATKNNPQLNPTGGVNLEKKLDIVIELLQGILKKNPVQLPSSTTHDLDLLIGEII